MGGCLGQRWLASTKKWSRSGSNAVGKGGVINVATMRIGLVSKAQYWRGESIWVVGLVRRRSPTLKKILESGGSGKNSVNKTASPTANTMASAPMVGLGL